MKLEIPKFESEAAEARWWKENRERAENLLSGAITGKTMRKGLFRKRLADAQQKVAPVEVIKK